MSYRDNLQALVDRHAALDAEVVRTQKQRDEVRAMIDNAQARLRLPVLDNIRVASPCKESWDGMSGDDRARLCLRCNQNVYNLSNLTREEAEALLVAKEGKLCVRYYRRKDGTILTQNCKVGAKRRRRWFVGLGAMATLAATVFGFRSSRGSDDAVMGDIGIDEHYDMVQGGAMALPEDYANRDEVVSAPDEPEPAPPHVGMRL